MKAPETIKALEKRKLEGAPRWMVTFADLMALLFALFVLLLSFAEVDSDSFHRNAGPMRDAFGIGDKMLSTTSRQQVEPGRAGPGAGRDQAATSPTAELLLYDKRRQAKRSFLFQFRRVMEREIAAARIILIDEGDRIIIRFPDATAFAAGSADLLPGFEPTLKTIATILAATKGQILISGHTDDRPIASARYRSNWDLSSARAATVIHYLVEGAGLAPGRITAQGYAESRPLAPNDTPEGRAQNRRVEIALEITEFSG